MEWIAALEKLKNPVIALLGGLLVGASVTWTAATNLHEERVKILETARVELERQIVVRDKAIDQKDSELQALSSKLTAQPVVASSNPKSSAELQKLIAQLDTEIEKKRVELGRNAGLRVVGFVENERHETPKSDAYVRIEQELQALNEQRNFARKKLIDGMSK